MTDYLTAANKESAAHVTAATHQLMSSLIHQALLNSKSQFERGDNL